MAGLCLITGGLTATCGAGIAKGVSPDVILYNFDEYTDDYAVANHVVTTITMASTKTGFTYEGIKTSARPKTVLKEGPYGGEFDMEIAMVAFKLDAASLKKLLTLNGAKVIALVKNNHTGTAGETKWFLYGRTVGLYMRVLEYDPYSDTAGIKFTLKTADESPEPYLPVPVFDTNIATTETMITGTLS